MLLKLICAYAFCKYLVLHNQKNLVWSHLKINSLITQSKYTGASNNTKDNKENALLFKEKYEINHIIGSK